MYDYYGHELRGKRVEVDDECGSVSGQNRCNFSRGHSGPHAEKRVIEEIVAVWDEED